MKGFDNKFKSSNAEDADFGYNITNSGKSIRLLRNVQVTHIPQWTFKDFIKKILRIHTGEMKMFLRRKNIKSKIEQKNYLPIIISIAFLFLQLFSLPFFFILSLNFFLIFILILNFLR